MDRDTDLIRETLEVIKEDVADFVEKANKIALLVEGQGGKVAKITFKKAIEEIAAYDEQEKVLHDIRALMTSIDAMSGNQKSRQVKFREELVTQEKLLEKATRTIMNKLGVLAKTKMPEKTALYIKSMYNIIGEHLQLKNLKRDYYRVYKKGENSFYFQRVFSFAGKAKTPKGSAFQLTVEILISQIFSPESPDMPMPIEIGVFEGHAPKPPYKIDTKDKSAKWRYRMWEGKPQESNKKPGKGPVSAEQSGIMVCQLVAAYGGYSWLKEGIIPGAKAKKVDKTILSKVITEDDNIFKITPIPYGTEIIVRKGGIVKWDMSNPSRPKLTDEVNKSSVAEIIRKVRTAFPYGKRKDSLSYRIETLEKIILKDPLDRNRETTFYKLVVRFLNPEISHYMNKEG